MFAAEWLFTVIIVCGLSLGRNSVDGYETWCPEPAIVNLTDETPDYSGAENKSGILFSPNATQDDDDGNFGCMCDIRECLPYCCPFGYAESSNGCIMDKYTTNVSEAEGSFDANKSHAFVYDPCELSSINNTSMKKYNWVRDDLINFFFREYCIFREVDSVEYLHRTCFARKSILDYFLTGHTDTWMSIIFGIVRVFFILMTLIAYIITPKLKHLRGLLVRCYIGSELTSYTLIWVSHILNAISTNAILLHQIFIWITVTAMLYFNSATTFWLIVLNFDVWRKFGRTLIIDPAIRRAYNKARFLRYSIRAWGGSIIATAIESAYIIWSDVADPLNWSTFVIFSVTFICFIILKHGSCIFFSIFAFISTASRIRWPRNNIGGVINDADRHHRNDTNEQRAHKYLALFTLMRCYEVFIVPVVFSNNEMYVILYQALATLHGIFTFYSFVWIKQPVRNSFRNQVIEMLPTAPVVDQI